MVQVQVSDEPGAPVWTCTRAARWEPEMEGSRATLCGSSGTTKKESHCCHQSLLGQRCNATNGAEHARQAQGPPPCTVLSCRVLRVERLDANSKEWKKKNESRFSFPPRAAGSSNSSHPFIIRPTPSPSSFSPWNHHKVFQFLIWSPGPVFRRQDRPSQVVDFYCHSYLRAAHLPHRGTHSK